MMSSNDVVRQMATMNSTPDHDYVLPYQGKEEEINIQLRKLRKDLTPNCTDNENTDVEDMSPMIQTHPTMDYS